MKYSLASYHIDKAKFGGILAAAYDCAFPKEDKNSSKAHSAGLMGLSDDVFSNMLKGKNQDCLVERLLKFCIHTRTPILSVIDKALEGEDVDFADDLAAIFAVPADIAEKYGISVHATDCTVIDGINSAKEVSIRQTEMVARQTEIITSEQAGEKSSLRPEILTILRTDQEALMDRLKNVHSGYTEQLVTQFNGQIQQLKDSRQITIDHYEERVSLINAQHAKHVEDIKEGHAAFAQESEKKFAKVEELYLKAIHRKNVWLAIVATLFVLETAGVIALLVYDATHPEIGFLRGLADLFSGTTMEVLRSMLSIPPDSFRT